MERWIKLYGKLLNSQYFREPKLLQLVIYCLLRAQWQATEFFFNGQLIKLEPGDFITSVAKICQHTGATSRTTRTRLKMLEASGFLTSETTNRFTRIHVNNWHIYQGNENGDKQNAKQTTSETEKSLKNDKQIDNIQEVKNKDKKVKKNIYIPVREVITYLNKATGKQYKENKPGTIKLIKARINEGYSLNDIQVVIDKKVKQWRHGDMDKYLRPETLFGNKFEGYHNEPDKTLSKDQQAVQNFIERTN